MLKILKKNYEKAFSLKTINQNVLKMNNYLPYEQFSTIQEINRNLTKYNQPYFFQEISEFNVLNPKLKEFILISLPELIIGHLITNNTRSFPKFLLDGIEFKNTTKIKFKYNNFCLLEQISFKIVQDYIKKLEKAKNSFIGLKFVRDGVVRYYKTRYNLEINVEDILLLNGSINCFKFLMELVLKEKEDSIMLSNPFDPLLKNRIELFGKNKVFYDLENNSSFNFCFKRFKKAFDDSSKMGKRIKAVFITNPNFPTGCVLKKNQIEEILEFASLNDFIIITNNEVKEVFFNEEKKFVSFHQILNEMEDKVKNSVRLVSYESISRGYHFNSGFRSGFMELKNFSENDKNELKNSMKETEPNFYGQILLDIYLKDYENKWDILNEDDNEIVAELRDSINFFYEDYFLRFRSMSSLLNKSPYFHCNVPDGGYCLFPEIQFPQSFLEEMRKLKCIPDVYYCQKLVEEIGISLIPGSSFGVQEECWRVLFFNDLYHPHSIIEIFEKINFFNRKFFTDYH